MVSKNKIKTSRTKKILISVFIIAVLLTCTVFFGELYIKYLELNEIGSKYVSVLTKNILINASAFVFCSIFLFVLLYINTSVIRYNMQNESIDNVFLQKKHYCLLITTLISFISAFFVCDDISNKILPCFNAIQFNKTELITGFDLSFFIFIKPFIDVLIKTVTLFFIISFVYIFVSYFLMFVDITHRNVSDMLKNQRISKHLIVNFAVMLFIIACNLWIQSIGIVYSDFAGLEGAGFVDVVLKQNLYKLFAIILCVVSIAIIVYRRKKIKVIIASFVTLVLLIVCGNVASFCIQSFYVSPNEVMVEYPYIKNNIEATRFGFNIDAVAETAYHVDNTITKSDFDSNTVMSNTRIIDYNSAVTATNQLQAMKNYYKFSDVDVSLYDINGKKELVALGVRELDKSSIEESAKNYTNEKLKFTHGYGIVMMATNKVTQQGEPYYYIKDLTLENETGGIEINQPRIYFGERQNDYSIVNTNTPEVDYSEGSVDHEFYYDADAGIRLNLLNRIVFSIAKADYKMLVTNQIHSQSKLLVNTNIIDRVKIVAPFLKYDTDPQAIIHDGSILWVINAYTYSDLLPYSAHNEGVNYIRNSVKVTVDAYTGETKFYIIDKSDPLINTYNRIYPEIFETKDIPDSIMEKSCYPEWLFLLQSRVYAMYHTSEPAAFYNKSDMYAVANEKYNNDIRQILPYYNYLKLDEFNKYSEEMVLMLPYTMYNRDNMVFWIAVGNSKNNYGKFVAYKFPKNLNIYGPLQIENLIDNDPEISKELALWNTGEGNVIRGNLLVIPVHDTILYIEPVYLNSNNQAALPVMQRVIVALGDRIAMDVNVENALSRVLDAGKNYSPMIFDEEDTTFDDLADDEVLNNIIDSYYELEKNASEGSWSAFGETMEKMKENIENLKNSLNNSN